MAEIMVNFENARSLHRVQEHRLGDWAFNADGDEYSYVQFMEAISVGHYVRDAVPSDLVSAGAVVASADIGSNILKDTGEFTNDDYVGAIGYIYEGHGKGQTFYIREMLDKDTIEIFVIATLAGFPSRNSNGGWLTALSSLSRYRLSFPGRVYQGDGLTDVVRGVSEVEVESTDVEKFGWVKRIGLGFPKLDASSANVPVIGEDVIPAAGGLVTGFTAAATTADEAAKGIGKSLNGDIVGQATTDDSLIPVQLDIRNRTLSYRFPHRTAARNNVTVQ